MKENGKRKIEGKWKILKNSGESKCSFFKEESTQAEEMLDFRTKNIELHPETRQIFKTKSNIRALNSKPSPENQFSTLENHRQEHFHI